MILFHFKPLWLGVVYVGLDLIVASGWYKISLEVSILRTILERKSLPKAPNLSPPPLPLPNLTAASLDIDAAPEAHRVGDVMALPHLGEGLDVLLMGRPRVVGGHGLSCATTNYRRLSNCSYLS